MMFAIDDDITKLQSIRELPIMDFFYYVSYKKDKIKLKR
jgi:hypothetical protein